MAWPIKIGVSCLVCDKVFYPFVCESKKPGRGKYCSRKCYYKSKKTGKYYKCEHCGKRMYVKKWQSGKKYCSNICASIYRRGEKSHTWKGGISPEYQKKFSLRSWDKIKKSILDRDGYMCQLCNKTIGRLAVHHIIPWRVSHDDRPENLITLCASCHSKEEHKLFKIYPY
jgi:5-methylcytosine-specific restriction endonuclease McrA